MVLTHILKKTLLWKPLFKKRDILQFNSAIVTFQILVNNLLTTCSTLGIIRVSTKFVKINFEPLLAQRGELRDSNTYQNLQNEETRGFV